MPVPIPQASGIMPLFPTLSKEQIDAARTSRWYDTFDDLTIPSTIIDLDETREREAFVDWLESDSIFFPEDSDGVSSSSSAAGPSGASSNSRSAHATPQAAACGEDDAAPPIYRLPKLNAAIRAALEKYGGGIFPKLNWTSPRDAAFILPQGSHGPCFCQSPSDVYLLLKSSDFISHDLDPSRAYASSSSSSSVPTDDRRGSLERMKIELVLKKFINIQPNQEFRCFVRNRMLLGITQRDLNYYDYLQSPETRDRICGTIREFWEDEIWDNYAGGDDYVFDLYLSENLSKCTIIDFNPYRPSTDPLLWTYDDLLNTLNSATAQVQTSADGQTGTPIKLPILRVIDSKSHPSANPANPAFGSNMMPIELVEMSQGRTIDDLRGDWEEAIRRGMADEGGSESDDE